MEKFESTHYANYKLELDASGNPVAVWINDKEAFRVGDRVKVTADCIGYICPGITKGGFGYVTAIVRDYTDHFFQVTMDNGQCGQVKEARIRRV